MNEKPIDDNYRRRLERNLVKYAWSQPMIMRVYYAVLGIYLVTDAHLSLTQIASLASITAIANIILQMPSGYFADKFGNKRALELGSLLSLTSPLWYVVLPSYWGALIGLALFTVGGTFLGNGTMESLVHDTLVKLGREKHYAKMMGRAQSYGLIGNTVLAGSVPLTYPLWHQLPFLLGFLTQIGLFILVRSFEYPDIARVHAAKKPIAALKSVVNLGNLAVFVFFGFCASLGWVSGAGEFLQIRIHDLGMAAALFGLVQAGGSLAGAALGRFMEIFDKLRPMAYYLLDLLIEVGCLFAIGFARNLPVAIIAAIIFMGWIRVRKIVFQAKLLSEMKHVYKATLISALSLFANIWQMIAPALLAWSVMTRGQSLASGYVLFATIALVIGLFLWSLIWLTMRRESKLKTA